MRSPVIALLKATGLPADKLLTQRNSLPERLQLLHRAHCSVIWPGPNSGGCGSVHDGRSNVWYRHRRQTSGTAACGSCRKSVVLSASVERQASIVSVLLPRVVTGRRRDPCPAIVQRVRPATDGDALAGLCGLAVLATADATLNLAPALTTTPAGRGSSSFVCRRFHRSYARGRLPSSDPSGSASGSAIPAAASAPDAPPPAIAALSRLAERAPDT